MITAHSPATIRRRRGRLAVIVLAAALLLCELVAVFVGWGLTHPVRKAVGNALLFDFRGSGESEGSRVTVGYEETRDLSGAVDYVRSRGAKRVALLGFSMGGTTALLTGARLPEVDAVVADSSVSELGPFLLENASHWTKLPSIPFSYLIYATVPPLLGADLDEVSATRAMPGLAGKPLLLIHGTADTAIGEHHVHDLMAAYVMAGGKQGELWVVPGARHVQAFRLKPAEYGERLLGFLARSL